MEVLASSAMASGPGGRVIGAPVLELRDVQHNLRKDIDFLGDILAFFNIALVPLIVSIFALAIAALRRRRRRRGLHHGDGVRAQAAGELAFLEAKLSLSANQAPLFAHWKQASLDVAKQHDRVGTMLRHGVDDVAKP